MPKMMFMDKREYAAALISHLGGTTATAAFFDVEPPSVSEWKYNGVPKARLMYVKAVRPDLFDESGGIKQPIEKPSCN